MTHNEQNESSEREKDQNYRKDRGHDTQKSDDANGIKRTLDQQEYTDIAGIIADCRRAEGVLIIHFAGEAIQLAMP